MAFSGLQIACAYVGPKALMPQDSATMRKPVWSESLPTAGTTTNTAPATTENGPVFRVVSAVDTYVSIGKAPDAAAEPRLLAKAGVPLVVYVEAGDKLAWIAA